MAPAKALGQEPAAVAPKGFVGLIGLVKDRPKEARQFFKSGTVEPGLLIQLGVAVLVLSALTAGADAWVFNPSGFRIGLAATFWLGMLFEMIGSAAILSLLCVLFKRDARPLGVGTGVATARVGAMAVTLVFAIVMVVVTLATRSPQGWPEPVVWLNRHVGTFYLAVVFCLQATLAVGLLELGCALCLILNLVAVYGAKTLAETLGGKF
jgi:hypothetical protein